MPGCSPLLLFYTIVLTLLFCSLYSCFALFEADYYWPVRPLYARPCVLVLILPATVYWFFCCIPPFTVWCEFPIRCRLSMPLQFCYCMPLRSGLRFLDCSFLYLLRCMCIIYGLFVSSYLLLQFSIPSVRTYWTVCIMTTIIIYLFILLLLHYWWQFLFEASVRTLAWVLVGFTVLTVY